MSADLLLEVREYVGPARWRWVLSGLDGTPIADHEVRLDVGSWQFEAFADLPGYLNWRAAPDRRAEDEARIVAEVGAWVGAPVLGRVGTAMLRARPATVRLRVPRAPETARDLLFKPLELAQVGDRPLGLSGVTLVRETAGMAASDHVKRPVDSRLRVLGLFSLPVGGQPLSLRRERQSLVAAIARTAAIGQAAEVRVMQYGVTRDRLREALNQSEGWDIIHMSGHGEPGELLLERADGSLDRISSGDLRDMLDLASERVKLVSMSACWSAAPTAADLRRQLGLPMPNFMARAGEVSLSDEDGTSSDSRSWFGSGRLAAELAERLGCAVLAMRYPITDEFATEFFTRLYERLAGKEAPLARMLGLGLSELAVSIPAATLSLYSPVLFGPSAATLQLAAPGRHPAESYDFEKLQMA